MPGPSTEAPAPSGAGGFPMSPIATILLAGIVGIAGAVAVVALDSALADAVGIAALACGLAATIWATLRMTSDPDARG